MHSSSPRAHRADATVASRCRVLRYTLGPRSARNMGAEPRRALAVFRALDFAGDTDAVRALLAYSGRAREPDAPPQISEPDCVALADVLRNQGYPLSDEGLRRFKMERGFSRVVRIGSDVAAALAAWSAGHAPEIDIDAPALSAMTHEGRRAVQVLALAAQDQDTWPDVLARLDAGAPPSPVVTASRVTSLLDWMHQRSWSLDDVGLRRLSRAVGFDVPQVGRRLASFVAAAITERDEPAHDYTRQLRGRHVLSRRTLTMLEAAQQDLGGIAQLKLSRGSYEVGESLGAHPHLGGGAVDISMRAVDDFAVEPCIRALRRQGFAAWYRQRETRRHIHAIAIGDREMSPAAAWQVKCFAQGRDGRSHSGPDPHAHLNADRPAWVARYLLPFT